MSSLVIWVSVISRHHKYFCGSNAQKSISAEASALPHGEFTAYFQGTALPRDRVVIETEETGSNLVIVRMIDRAVSRRVALNAEL